MALNLFSQTLIPEILPDEMQKIIAELKLSSDKRECLQRAYTILSSKYRGYRVMTYLKFFDLFESDPRKLWEKSGFMHCTNINYLIKILLIKSGFFEETDIRSRWTLSWYFSPHQYLQILLDEGWIDIDIWAVPYGIKFGDHSHGFH